MMNDADFLPVMNRHKDTVYRVAFSYTKNRQDAEDIFQEVFLKLARKAPELESEERERAWLIRVTINTCISFLRNPWHRHRAEFENYQAVQNVADSSDLMDAIHSLPGKLSTPLLLRYYEGYSVKECARLLGISESAVTSRLFRARKQLKLELEESSI